MKALKYLSIGVLSLIALLIASCSKGKDKIPQSDCTYIAASPQEAAEIFITGLIEDDTNAMLSVVGRCDGSALDWTTYVQVKLEMDEAVSMDEEIPKIKTFKIISTDFIENDIAQCEVEVTFENDSVSIEANTLIKGGDGGWRLPFFE